MTAGYWQCELDEADKAKTEFQVRGRYSGCWEFNRLAFGLKNAPSAFQRAMEQLIGGIRFEFVLVYIDDLVIHSTTFETHMEHMTIVLALLRKHGLTLKTSKC